MSTFTFQRGERYAAGFSKPWFVPETTVKKKVEALGFRILGWWPCSDGGIPVRVPRPCGDGYDLVSVVDRLGPTTTLALPGAVSWVQSLGRTASGAGKPAPVSKRPADMSAAELHRWARGVLLRVWPGEAAQLGALQIVQGVASHEGLYGWAAALEGLRGRNNWGNVTCACDQVGTGPCVRHGAQCYKAYASAEDGARDLIHELEWRGAFVLAVETRSVAAVIQRMANTTYFTAPELGYADGVWRNIGSIAAANGEPVAAVRRRGTGIIAALGALSLASVVGGFYAGRRKR